MLTTSSNIQFYSQLFYAKVVRIQNICVIAVDDYYGNTITAREQPYMWRKIRRKGTSLNCKANDIILIGKTVSIGRDINGNENYRYDVLYKYSDEEIPELNIQYKWPKY